MHQGKPQTDLEQVIAAGDVLLQRLHLSRLVLQHRAQALGADIGSMQVFPCAAQVSLQQADLREELRLLQLVGGGFEER